MSDGDKQSRIETYSLMSELEGKAKSYWDFGDRCESA